MVRYEIINTLIKKHKYKTYLEIGVDNGQCFTAIDAEYKECVDPSSSYPATHRMGSDEFFAINEKSFDIVFIDGLHHSDQVDRDIANSIELLSDGGCIVLHDCSPSNELYQRVPRETGIWNGDVWKSITRFIHANHKKYEVFTIDSDNGCSVIRSGSCKCNFKMPKELTYDWLDDNRKAALNLISVEQFLNIA